MDALRPEAGKKRWWFQSLAKSVSTTLHPSGMLFILPFPLYSIYVLHLR